MFIAAKCIYECSIDAFELKKCLEILKANKVAFLAYTNQTIYAAGEQPGLDAFKKRLIGKCEIIENANIDDIIKESIFKVVMIHPEMVLASDRKGHSESGEKGQFRSERKDQNSRKQIELGV